MGSRLREVLFLPQGTKVRVHDGVTVLDAARTAGVSIPAPCGGEKACGKCKVVGLSGLDGLSDLEKGFLSQEELRAGTRLACRARIVDDACVELLIDDEFSASKELLATTHRYRHDIDLDPAILKIHFKLEEPTFRDPRSDFERIRDFLLEQGYPIQDPDLSLLRDLPVSIRRENFEVTAAISEGQLIAVEPGDTSQACCGVAADIGTTTVAAYLMDLVTGRQLAVKASENPQSSYGVDIIDRIASVSLKPRNLRRQQTAIMRCINDLVDALVRKADVVTENIYEMVVVGNTTMLQLFLGVDPRPLASAPYIAAFSEPLKVSAKELGIRINPNGKVRIAPSIASFMGADTVGVILYGQMDLSSEIRLAVDIGTNGETVLGSKEGMVACSNAAGPAFEGRHIACGMRATSGAIDRIHLTDGVSYHVIGDGPPKGICGSGLLQGLAQMRKAGLLDVVGRIRTDGVAPEELRARIRKGEYGPELVVASEKEGAYGKSVAITQNDVREVQLAKAAICAGIKILQKELGVQISDISEIIFAGAFGSLLDSESAVVIGLIPPFPLDRIKAVGNAAGEGAKMMLLSRDATSRAKRIPEMVNYVLLSHRSDFQKEFLRAMHFPS